MTSATISATPDCEIVSTRVVNTPVERVYTAWADPYHLQKWWGPAGFTNTFNEFDFRPGGRWSFIMHGADQGHYANECEFTHIIKPTLIAWKRFSKPIFEVIATFEALTADRTKIVFKQIFNSANECNKIKVFAAEKNEENFDRLEQELILMTTQGL